MIIGIDEVGRGCWAGPLVASAVALPTNHGIIGLNDSKKLSVKKRVMLDIQIRDCTKHIGIGWVWPDEINAVGLSKSVQLAMQRAYDELCVTEYEELIIDGSINYLPHIAKSRAVVKADGLVAAVSAASIIAKVARDNYMNRISSSYPEYGFEKHVGYGTKAHHNALILHGVLPIHRINYKPIRALL